MDVDQLREAACPIFLVLFLIVPLYSFPVKRKSGILDQKSTQIGMEGAILRSFWTHAFISFILVGPKEACDVTSCPIRDMVMI